MKGIENKKDFAMLIITIFIVIILLLVVVKFTFTEEQDLDVVTEVDLNKYSGKWFSVYEYPNNFQNNCSCVTADYDVVYDDEGRVVNINVTNRCNNINESISGKAYLVDGGEQGELIVDFGFFREGDYNIIYLNEDYSTAVVGTKDRNYLWVLSRTIKLLPSEEYLIFNRIDELGYNQSNLMKVEHNCEK